MVNHKIKSIDDELRELDSIIFDLKYKQSNYEKAIEKIEKIHNITDPAKIKKFLEATTAKRKATIKNDIDKNIKSIKPRMNKWYKHVDQGGRHITYFKLVSYSYSSNYEYNRVNVRLHQLEFFDDRTTSDPLHYVCRTGIYTQSTWNKNTALWRMMSKRYEVNSDEVKSCINLYSNILKCVIDMNAEDMPYWLRC